MTRNVSIHTFCNVQPMPDDTGAIATMLNDTLLGSAKAYPNSRVTSHNLTVLDGFGASGRTLMISLICETESYTL